MTNRKAAVYVVSGNRRYRGHDPGEEFVARLDGLAAQRAIARGDIRLIDSVDPMLSRRSLVLPAGWSGKSGAGGARRLSTLEERS